MGSTTWIFISKCGHSKVKSREEVHFYKKKEGYYLHVFLRFQSNTHFDYKMGAGLRTNLGQELEEFKRLNEFLAQLLVNRLGDFNFCFHI